MRERKNGNGNGNGDPLDFNNLTAAQIERLWKALFRHLLFEPVTDLDFERPAEKLRGLLQESMSLIERLRAVVHRYDDYLGVVAKPREIFDDGKPYMEKVWSFGTDLPSVEQTIYDAFKLAIIPADERERGQRKEALVRELRHDAMGLSLAYKNINGVLVLVPLSIRASQLTTAQLWAFLEKSTATIAKGTAETFHQHTMPTNPEALLSDAVDQIREKAELPNITPLWHLMQFIFNYIRRKEIREKKIEETWTAFQMKIFFLGFFNWWTDAGGSPQVEKMVSECEETLRLHEEQVRGIVAAAAEFGRALADFQKRVDENCRQSSENEVF